MLIKFVLKKLASDAAASGSFVAEYFFDGSLVTVGSDAASTIVLPESAPEQAVIVYEDEQLTLINSSDGTIINGRNLRREAMEPLSSGDQIQVGSYVVSVVVSRTSDSRLENNADLENNEHSINVLPEKSVLTVEDKNESPAFEEAIRNGKSDSSAKKPARNFADVLNALRTEEDSFYFIVGNITQEETRLPIEQTETPLGLNASGQISCAVDQIAALYAIVRKDWSGIVIESQRSGAVFVNDEALKTTVRLRNGDCLTFNGNRKNNKKVPYLELHEPSSLVALESILETRSRSQNSHRSFGGAAAQPPATLENNPVLQPSVSVFERDFFGYFSFFELVTMAIGTLIAAILIFLLLEFTV